MIIKEITAKSILLKPKKFESWFLGGYGMNLYRGCLHNCPYCDGRAERYNVDGDFGSEISVKINAEQLLRRELDPARKRKPMNGGFIFLGGGVGDAYQPVDKKYQLARKALELIAQFNHPVHILTKSTLVKRDLDLIDKINKQKRAVLSHSFSTVDPDLCRIFEPGVPSPHERLQTIKLFKSRGIACGMYLMPVIPFLTDTEKQMNQTLIQAKQAGIDFVIFGGMTLKEGRQKTHFYNLIKKQFPDLLPKFQEIYQWNQWGQAIQSYYIQISRTFSSLAEKHRIPVRIPPYIYHELLAKHEQVIVILEHIDYLLKLKGNRSAYGYAAYLISQIREPNLEKYLKISKIRNNVKSIIKEIWQTGKCKLLAELLNI